MSENMNEKAKTSEEKEPKKEVSFQQNERNNGYKKFFKIKKKRCILCQKGALNVDYKDIDLLKRYVDFDHTGKILSHYITGACPRHQRQISNAIHRARIVALLPFINKD